jgi:hypothetical protein
MASPTNRTTFQASLQKLIDGLTKRAATIASLILGGKTLANAQIVAQIQQVIAAETAAVTARAALKAAVLAASNQRATSSQLLYDLKQTLRAMFSGQPDVLADFGLTPRKTAAKTPEEKVATAAKAKATRKARGTDVGKVKRKEITGNVTGVIVTPIIAPAAAQAPAPQPVPEPAPTAPPAPSPAQNVAPSAPAAQQQKQ